jgi:hypothetical protein
MEYLLINLSRENIRENPLKKIIGHLISVKRGGDA